QRRAERRQGRRQVQVSLTLVALPASVAAPAIIIAAIAVVALALLRLLLGLLLRLRALHLLTSAEAPATKVLLWRGLRRDRHDGRSAVTVALEVALNARLTIVETAFPALGRT